MDAIIVAAGCDLTDPREAQELLGQSDLVICADGGLNFLEKLNILPDVVLGDFDSAENLSFLYEGEKLKEGVLLQSFPVRKDQTDLELALDYALDKGIDRCIILGGTGSRLDHSLCNIFLLERYQRLGLSAQMVNETNRISYWTEGEYRLPKTKPGWYQSFLAMPEDVHLSLEGFDYDLDDQLLARGSSLAISNHVIRDDARVIVRGKGVYTIRSTD